MGTVAVTPEHASAFPGVLLKHRSLIHSVWASTWNVHFLKGPSNAGAAGPDHRLQEAQASLYQLSL